MSCHAGGHRTVGCSNCGQREKCTNPEKDSWEGQWCEEWKEVEARLCHFCGKREAYIEIKHPGASWWKKLLGRDWFPACQDCSKYMISLWTRIWGALETRPLM